MHSFRAVSVVSKRSSTVTLVGSSSCFRAGSCSSLRGLQRVRWAPLRCTLLVHQNVTNVSILTSSNYVRAWVSAPHAQLDTASPGSTDSLTGCAGLAANGAGPRRCTAGVTPASVRTRDRRTEARTGPGPLCPRNGRPHPGFPGVT